MARKRLTSETEIVDSALELIDEQGVEALTMRALGRRLGVEGMALYTYFRSKDELLDAVGTRILAALETEFDRSLPWQERIRSGALAWAAMQASHPRAFGLVCRGGVRTEAVPLLTEELLDALRVAGFDERGAALAYQSVVVLIDAALLGRGTSTDADLHAAWRHGAARLDPDTYPRFRELAPHAATLAWEEILESGLDLLLRGLEQRLAG